MPDPLQDTFTVEVEGDTYTFKIPTIRHDIEVDYKAADIRNRAYPAGAGTFGGLSMGAVAFSRYCAYLELYLVRATTAWPYGSADDDLSKIDFSTPPVVDFDRFPVDRTEDIYAVGQAFETEVARFRRRRDPNRQPAGA